jgi:hypothetical protein
MHVPFQRTAAWVGQTRAKSAYRSRASILFFIALHLEIYWNEQIGCALSERMVRRTAQVETDGYTCRAGQRLAVSSSASGSSGSKDEMTESQTTLKRIEFNENIVALLGFAVLLISVVFLADRPPIRWAAIRFPND